MPGPTAAIVYDMMNVRHHREATGQPPVGMAKPPASAAAWVLAVVLLLSFTAHAGMPAGYPEYQVKAAWMLNFTRFVDWPANAFATRDAPCIVGILGKDPPFGSELAAAFASKTIRGRRFELQHVQRESDTARCHMLFIPASERRTWRELQSRLGKMPVLTIGEAEGFLDLGSIINFVIQDGAIAFEIDLGNAQKAGLKFDANVLKIAARVKGKYE
jgi:YfiR/HmsC-like